MRPRRLRVRAKSSRRIVEVRWRNLSTRSLSRISMKRRWFALVWIAGVGECDHAAAAPAASFMETDLPRDATCAGEFKAAAVANAPGKFPDSLAQPVRTPIVWNRFRGERELFGYSPAFVPNRVSFATNGRPIIRDRDMNLQVLIDDGRWMRISLKTVLSESLKQQGALAAANAWAQLSTSRCFPAGRGASSPHRRSSARPWCADSGRASRCGASK
jgi:hypothetical protein